MRDVRKLFLKNSTVTDRSDRWRISFVKSFEAVVEGCSFKKTIISIQEFYESVLYTVLFSMHIYDLLSLSIYRYADKSTIVEKY